MCLLMCYIFQMCLWDYTIKLALEINTVTCSIWAFIFVCRIVKNVQYRISPFECLLSNDPAVSKQRRVKRGHYDRLPSK